MKSNEPDLNIRLKAIEFLEVLGESFVILDLAMISWI
jgi:hypothetical protein